jgi:hypothetical protein
MRMPRMRTWHWLIAGALFILLACVVIHLFLDDKIADWANRRAFDADLWRQPDQAAPYSAWPPRLCMVDALLASGRLNGMTESQVLELLGPPDSKSVGLNYYLGPERGFLGIDSETLVIEFGADGKVSRPRIYRD